MITVAGLNWFPWVLVVIFALGCLTTIEYGVRAVIFLVKYAWTWWRA